MSEETPILIRMTHVGGSSRPCEVRGVTEKSVRGKRRVLTTISARWGSAGVYDVDPMTGKVTGLANWTADVADCKKAIEEWKLRAAKEAG